MVTRIVRALGLALGLATVALPVGGCRQTDSGAEVSTRATVQRGPFERELLLTGELEAVRSVEIKAPQTSLFQMRITFMAEEGATVERGAPLLDFDNSSLAAQVRDLETQILDAQTQIVGKRSELRSSLKDLEIELAEKQTGKALAALEAGVTPEVLSRREHGERQLALAKAARELDETIARIALTRERGQAELDVLIINRDKLEKDLLSARQDLELLLIKAPSDGLVVYSKRDGTTLRYQEGDSCWPGQAVLRLPDLEAMRVSFYVSEVDAPALTVGMPVAMSLDAFPGRRLAGTISHIPSMAIKRNEDSKMAIFKITAELSETWVGEMKPGMSALGRVNVESRADAPQVARGAVRFDGEAYWVRIGGGSSKAAEIQIEPLARNPSHYLLSEEDYRKLAPAAVSQAGDGDGAGEDRT